MPKPALKPKPGPLPCGRPLPQREEARKGSPRDSWRELLQGHLAKEGLKHSDQRLKIVELILGEDRHFRTQDMVRKVQVAYPGIGAATVYRNIKLLQDALILKETLIEDDGRQVVYELTDEDHHDHIVCVDCGEIFEFHEEEIEAIQERLSQKLSFRPASHRHVIYAHCEYAKKPLGRK